MKRHAEMSLKTYNQFFDYNTPNNDDLTDLKEQYSCKIVMIRH